MHTIYTLYTRYTHLQTPTKVDGDSVHSCGGAGVSRAGSGEHKRLSTHVHTRLLYELDGRLDGCAIHRRNLMANTCRIPRIPRIREPLVVASKFEYRLSNRELFPYARV